MWQYVVCVLCAVQSETAACVLCAVQSETAVCDLCAVHTNHVLLYDKVHFLVSELPSISTFLVDILVNVTI